MQESGHIRAYFFFCLTPKKFYDEFDFTTFAVIVLEMFQSILTN